MQPFIARTLALCTLAAACSALSLAAADKLNTQPLEPRTYHFKLNDLPPPRPEESANKRPDELEVPANATLFAPRGFTVSVFASEIDQARWLALTPTGDVLVTRSRGDDITLLRDLDKNGVAETKLPFAGKAEGLNQPFGMAFHDGHLFIANTDSVMRFDYRPGQEKLVGPGKKIHDLPGGGYNQHWTRNVILSADMKSLFVTVGSESNVDVEPAPRASILQMDLDGANSRVFASGLRNPIGLALHPVTRELYACVNERDRIGNDLVPDYFTRVIKDAFYGWPYAYLAPENLDPRHLRNGKSTNPGMAARTVTPDVLIESHSAALGLTFYTGKAFPERYRNGAYIALRGSWNREQGTGYKIIYVPFDDRARPLGQYEDFVTGFLVDPKVPSTWGRPVGIIELPDGSLLFTDDTNGRVYRVSYDAREAAANTARTR